MILASWAVSCEEQNQMLKKKSLNRQHQDIHVYSKSSEILHYLKWLCNTRFMFANVMLALCFQIVKCHMINNHISYQSF